MCYFLHYGKFMRILRFDRASLVVSEIVDIKKVSLLLAVVILKKTQRARHGKTYHVIEIVG